MKYSSFSRGFPTAFQSSWHGHALALWLGKVCSDQAEISRGFTTASYGGCAGTGSTSWNAFLVTEANGKMTQVRHIGDFRFVVFASHHDRSRVTCNSMCHQPS